MISRARTIPLVFLSWTIFVWGIVRLRNIVTDTELVGADMVIPLLLSATFWIPAVVLIFGLFRSGGRDGRPSPWVVRGLVVLAAWTTAVWIYKTIDIAVFSDHPAGFIVVHTVLGIISIFLAVSTALGERTRWEELQRTF